MKTFKMHEQPDYQEVLSPDDKPRRNSAPELIRSANRLEVSNASVLYNELSLADMAHIIMLMEAEIVPKRSGQKLLGAFLEAHAIPISEFPLDPSLGDFYNCREHYIKELVPDVAGWQRVARARREATNIAFQIAVRRRLLALLRGLGELASALVIQAKKHVDTVMPDYTYLHQAQPTTFAHYLLGFVYPMLRDASRLRACFEHVNLSPGGIGSVNGSRLPINRTRLAKLLGFDGVVHHTRDAMWQADIPIEVTASTVALLVNLSRLAEDLQIWTTQEYNLVDLADCYCRDSVIMPQKKNPYSLNYIRGLANVTIGNLVGMANVGRTPTGQPDNRIFAYGEVPSLLDKTLEAAQLMAGVVSTIKVNISVMADKLKLGYSQATDLAEAIMLATGLPYQTAHTVVQKVVNVAIKNDISAKQISAEMIDNASKTVLGRTLNLSPEAIKKALDPSDIISTRTGIGGAAEKPMQEMLKQCQERITEIQAWQDETENRLMNAEANLVNQVKKTVKSIKKTQNVKTSN